MRRAEAIILIAVAPLLMATESFITPNGRQPPSIDKRQRLEQYNYELDGVIESQIEKIAALDSASEVKKLRDAHYSWKLKRDLQCAQAGRSASDAIAELECRAEAAESHYQELEARIDALENATDLKTPVPNTPHNPYQAPVVKGTD